MGLELAKKAIQEHTIVPDMPDIANSAKQMDTITYCFAPSCQNMCPKDLEPRLFPKKSANIVCPPPAIQELVFILSQETTMTGYVSKVRSVLYSVIAKMMTTWNGSIKDLKNG